MSMEFAAWNSLYSVMTAQQERRPFSRATVRRIFAFARHRRAMLAGFIAISVVGAVLAVATPVLAGRVVDALVNRTIAGAGPDVFADEPRVPEALLGLDTVVLQPHAASATNETRDAMAKLVVDNLAAHFAGRPLLTPLG